MRKFLLLSLALVWGYLVYGFDQSIGYEKGVGPPSVLSSLGWAYCAALPLFVSALVKDKNYPSQKFHYQVCVVWLSIQAVFLIFFSWLTLLGLVPVLGLGLILWPHPAQTANNLKTLWRGPALTLLALGGLLYWWHYNPLPSDEEMIARFHEHRPEIEEMVRRYRECELESLGGSCELLPENQALMKKARVKRVVGEAPTWHPNPYSRKAAKQFHDLLSTGKIPSLNPYSTIVVELLDTKHPSRDFTSVLTSSGTRLAFKDLAFIPEIAKIEGESLLLAVSPLCNCRFDEMTGKLRIFPSLDTYPTNWITGECVYRQFETHWFISLCAAAV